MVLLANESWVRRGPIWWVNEHKAAGDTAALELGFTSICNWQQSVFAPILKQKIKPTFILVKSILDSFGHLCARSSRWSDFSPPHPAKPRPSSLSPQQSTTNCSIAVMLETFHLHINLTISSQFRTLTAAITNWYSNLLHQTVYFHRASAGRDHFCGQAWCEARSSQQHSIEMVK